MSRPIPYVVCLTKESMHRAIRALYAAGYRCREYDAKALMDYVPDDDTCVKIPYLAYGMESSGVSPAYLWPCGQWNAWVAAGTQCNSVQHMIAYLKRHSA